MAPEPNFQPEDVYTRPEILYKGYKSVVVFVDMKDLPAAQREPWIVTATEMGLRERGYNILSHNDYMAFLKKKAISSSQSGEPRLLALLKKELGKTAIIRVHVRDFMAQGKMGDRRKIVTPGVPGVRETPLTPLEEGLHDWREWAIDLSLTFDMIDTSTADKIWSCSLSCSQFPYEGRLQDFIKKAVAECLDTIPAR